MSVDDFARTRRGAKFFDADLPALVAALETIAGRLAGPARTDAGDHLAMNQIQTELARHAFDRATVEAITQIVRASGRPVQDLT